jgi:hypothetical protein
MVFGNMNSRSGTGIAVAANALKGGKFHIQGEIESISSRYCLCCRCFAFVSDVYTYLITRCGGDLGLIQASSFVEEKVKTQSMENTRPVEWGWESVTIRDICNYSIFFLTMCRMWIRSATISFRIISTSCKKDMTRTFRWDIAAHSLVWICNTGNNIYVLFVFIYCLYDDIMIMVSYLHK